MAQVKNFEPEEILSLFEGISITGWIAIVVCWFGFNAVIRNLTKNAEEEISLGSLIWNEAGSTLHLLISLTVLLYTTCWSWILGGIISSIVQIIILLIEFFLYDIIMILKPNKAIMQYISSLKWIDFIFYDYLYQIINGPVPLAIYELNFKYNNIYDCGICLDPFCKLSYGDESILSCGHRFHSHCIRKWEMQQFNKNPYNLYQCPCCRQPYNWQKKWNYTYTVALLQVMV